MKFRNLCFVFTLVAGIFSLSNAATNSDAVIDAQEQSGLGLDLENKRAVLEQQVLDLTRQLQLAKQNNMPTRCIKEIYSVLKSAVKELYRVTRSIMYYSVTTSSATIITYIAYRMYARAFCLSAPAVWNAVFSQSGDPICSIFYSYNN